MLNQRKQANLIRRDFELIEMPQTFLRINIQNHFGAHSAGFPGKDFADIGPQASLLDRGLRKGIVNGIQTKIAGILPAGASR